MRWWKVAGLAGLAGVAATGVVMARQERRRRAYSPDEIRERLHARVSEADQPPGTTTADQPGTTTADQPRTTTADD
ncbi:hypothetical protein AB0M36_03180 [Actinoplanes sp. NPDC051346]|uniref:hypothetical protein n=1 Tax=Actinoplanes sp. NPDC051346 TaxID=3155048 RepID=UPI003435E8B4